MEDRLRTGSGPGVSGAGGSGRGAPGAGAPHSRDLLRVAFGPSVVALVVIAAVVLVQLVAANSDLTGTLGAVASMWLACHQVPVTLAGQQLGVLPLVPPALLVWATARGTAQITPPNGSWFLLRWIVASAVGGPVLLTAVSLAVVHDAASVITVLQTPNALHAFGSVLTVHLVGAVAGVGSKAGRRELARLGLPDWLTDTVRPAIIGVLTLLALSCAVVAGSLVVHWSTMHELFGLTDSFIGQLSLTALSVLYLPNVVLGTAAVAVGSSASIGFATFSAFTVFGGDIPAVPILAAAPTPPLGPVWVALLIVGAAAGVALGQQCARKPLPVGAAFAKLAVAALLAAGSLAGLAYFGGGQLGNFGHVGVDQATFAPAAFFWFFVIGGLTVVLAGGLRPRPKPVVRPDTVAVEGEPLTEPIRLGVDPDPDTDTDPATERVATAEPGQRPDPEPEPEPASPPPVRPAPEVEDVEDLMFVDDDIEDDDIGHDDIESGPGQPPAGSAGPAGPR